MMVLSRPAEYKTLSVPECNTLIIYRVHQSVKRSFPRHNKKYRNFFIEADKKKEYNTTRVVTMKYQDS